ncbi:MAG TPA: biopolymer transporter ExbD [Hydrogenophaga sp.]|uniref:ExbD/TolR family protein n=1 Tax=Hydrogenophaga sp. TaxID=1904254 RepID=UPI002C3B352E|nr:biopolymer transporter ExbD [Hydrogenophaga sp.]HSX95163.1 biopolymer transporter ExbD [Hydrogenophaga sp.]
MNFRSSGHRDEPEINLIPFIDILLVVLIFLVLTTTYSKFTELQVNLPTADAEAPKQNPKEIVVAVGADGRYAVNRTVLEGTSVELIASALQASVQDGQDTVVVISADAAAAHQAVINVMDAARRAGLVQITFATQQSGNAAPARKR